MSVLKNLTIAADLDNTKVDPVAVARDRLTNALKQQLKAATAMVEGRTYMVERVRTEANTETGEKTTKTIQVPLRKWYWRDAEGKLRFCLRVGNKRLDLDQGKTNIVVGDDDTALPGVIETCIKAVENGELDGKIKAALADRKPKKAAAK